MQAFRDGQSRSGINAVDSLLPDGTLTRAGADCPLPLTSTLGTRGSAMSLSHRSFTAGWQNLGVHRLLQRAGQKAVGRTDLLHQFARYRATVFWLYKQLFQHNKITMLFALGVNTLGVALQAAALSFLLYYANRMEQDDPLALSGVTVDPRAAGTFISAVAIVGIALLVSAALIFFGNRTITRVAAGFASDCSQSTVALQCARPPLDVDPSDAPYPKAVTGRATGLVGLARAVRPLMQLSNPTILFLYSVAVLFYIDGWLTTGMIIMILPSLVFHYAVNYHAAQNQKRLGRAVRRAQRSIVRLLDGLAWAPSVHGSQRALNAQLYADPTVREALDRYSFRVMAQPYSQLISDILIAVVAFVVVARLGSHALAGGVTWATFLGYLIFARIALVSSRGTLSAITGFARHYPTSRKAYELLSSEPRPQRFEASHLRLSRRRGDTIGDRRTAHLRRGTPVAALSSVPVSRYNAYYYVDCLVSRRSPANDLLRASCHCVPCAFDAIPGGSLRELLDISPEQPQQVVGAGLEALDARGALAGHDWDAPLTPEDWRQLPRQLRAHILLAQAAHSLADLLLVEAEVLDACSTAFRRAWWAQVKDRFVLIRQTDLSRAGQHGTALALALGQDRAVALFTAEWCRDNQRSVHQWIATHDAKAATKPGQQLDDEDEDDG